MQATQEQLSAIDGVGEVIALSITNWFTKKENKKIIEKLRKGGVDFGNIAISQLPQNLVGKAIVVTGSIEGFTREQAEAAIKDRGGKSPGSVSAKTYCLVVGDEPGESKITKARDLKVSIVQGADFQNLLNSGAL